MIVINKITELQKQQVWGKLYEFNDFVTYW